MVKIVRWIDYRTNEEDISYILDERSKIWERRLTRNISVTDLGRLWYCRCLDVDSLVSQSPEISQYKKCQF